MHITEQDDCHFVSVRQSWLNDAMLCPERARLKVNLPDWDSPSDATTLGTAVHTAIEHVLNYEASPNDMAFIMAEDIKQMSETKPFKWTSMKTIDQMIDYGVHMTEAWARDIYPEVERGGEVERSFTVFLNEFEHTDGKPVKVFLNGTMDYVTPSGVVWDWKTSARKYSQAEKQKMAIQASVYAYAVKNLFLAPDWPVQFKYGVMTRSTNSVGQIVPIVRTEAHGEWLRSQVTNIVRNGMRAGFEDPWLANDQNYLCSQRWCPFWSICKGAHLSESDNNMEASNA